MAFTMIYNDNILPIRVISVGGRGPLNQQVTRRDAQNGFIYIKKRFPERQMPVKFDIPATSLSDLRAKVDQLNALLNVDGPKATVFSDEPTLTYYAILDGDQDWEEIYVKGKGTLNFVRQPFKDGQLKITTNLTIDVGGTAPTLPIIQVNFTDSASSFKVTNQEGKYVKVDYNFTMGDQLIIDFSKRKITINNIIHMTALDWANSEWFSLKPGDNNLTISPTGVATVQITYTERWL